MWCIIYLTDNKTAIATKSDIDMSGKFRFIPCRGYVGYVCSVLAAIDADGNGGKPTVPVKRVHIPVSSILYIEEVD